MRSFKDKLTLCGLDVMCVIGDQSCERDIEQRLVLDISLICDLTRAEVSDELCDTLDYTALADLIRTGLRNAKFRLIEAAAGHVAKICLAHSRVARVCVRVEKSGCVTGMRAAVVEIVRSKARMEE